MASGTPSTPSSERYLARRWYTSRPVTWFTIVVCGAIGAASVWAAATDPSVRTTAVSLALIMLPVAVAMLLTQRSERVGWSRTTLEGAPAWSLAVRDPGVATAGGAACLGIAAGIAYPAVASGETGALVLAAVPVLLLLVVGLELARTGLVRRPALLVSADALVYRGPGVDARIAWDDVASVEYTGLRSRWAAVHAVALRDAPSYRARTRRFLLPTDRLPDPPGVALRTAVTPQPEALLALLRRLHDEGRDVRAHRIAHGLPETFAQP